MQTMKRKPKGTPSENGEATLTKVEIPDVSDTLSMLGEAVKVETKEEKLARYAKLRECCGICPEILEMKL
jgi:hypothetical protein